MNKYHDKSEGREVFAAQQMLNASHLGPVAAAILTQEDIAKHAYEIYVEKGCQQGQSEQNWLQAEQQLKNQRTWLQAGRDMKNQDQAGYAADY
jgi:hypothetical protein